MIKPGVRNITNPRIAVLKRLGKRATLRIVHLFPCFGHFAGIEPIAQPIFMR